MFKKLILHLLIVSAFTGAQIQALTYKLSINTVKDGAGLMRLSYSTSLLNSTGSDITVTPYPLCSHRPYSVKSGTSIRLNNTDDKSPAAWTSCTISQPNSSTLTIINVYDNMNTNFTIMR